MSDTSDFMWRTLADGKPWGLVYVNFVVQIATHAAPVNPKPVPDFLLLNPRILLPPIVFETPEFKA